MNPAILNANRCFHFCQQGRKKKTVEYVAVKSVEKFRRKKVLNEVSSNPPGSNLPGNQFAKCKPSNFL